MIEKRKVIECTYVTFDDSIITGINCDMKESLKFENESELEDSKKDEDCEETMQTRETIQSKNLENSHNPDD